MHPEVIKEYARLEKEYGITVTEEVIRKSINEALADLLRQGMPREMLERMLRSARPMGDFSWFAKRMPKKDFQVFFGGSVRKWGIDGSRDRLAYGASTSPEILNISPYRCSMDTYETYMGKPEKKDPAKEEIFFSGHEMEPVYRSYFDWMFGDRYTVFETDIQWESRKYDHFIGNVDGLLLDNETGKFGLLEIKHTSGNNIRTQRAVQDGDVPKYWDMQERCYMELLDLDFACLFLGWGNRPGLETNAMHRTERDPDIGESVLDACEEFMVFNVEARNKPSYKNVKDPDRVKQSIEEVYGPMDPKKEPFKFDKSRKELMDQILEKQKDIETLKAVKKEAEKKVKEAEAELDLMTIPLIEDLKTSPEGVFVDGATHYEVTYKPQNALDIAGLKADCPEVYEKYNKLAVDTEALKKGNPEEYLQHYGPKKGGKRKFTLRTWKSRR